MCSNEKEERIDKEGDTISLGALMAKAVFRNGMAGLDAVLEAYYKTVVAVTLCDEAPRMNYKDSVAFIKANLPPYLVHCKCLRDYWDIETHKVTLVYKKRPDDVLREREKC